MFLETHPWSHVSGCCLIKSSLSVLVTVTVTFTFDILDPFLTAEPKVVSSVRSVDTFLGRIHEWDDSIGSNRMHSVTSNQVSVHRNSTVSTSLPLPWLHYIMKGHRCVLLWMYIALSPPTLFQTDTRQSNHSNVKVAELMASSTPGDP